MLTKAFDAEYIDEPGLPPVDAEIDTVLTIAAAVDCLNSGSNPRVILTTACWFSSTIASY